MAVAELNIVAILVATALAMGVGALWYSPVAFAKAWMAAVGKKPDDLGNPAAALSMTAVNTLVEAAVLAVVVGSAGVASIVGGALVGVMVWLGFVVTAHLLGVFFEGRSLTLVAIDAGHQLFTYMVMGAVLGAWR